MCRGGGYEGIKGVEFAFGMNSYLVVEKFDLRAPVAVEVRMVVSMEMTFYIRSCPATYQTNNLMA